MAVKPGTPYPFPIQFSGPNTVMRRLHDLSTQLTKPGDYESLLTNLLAGAMEVAKADRGVIRVFDIKSGHLAVAVQRGLSPTFVDTLGVQTVAPGDGADWSLGNGVVIEDLSTKAGLEPSWQAALRTEGIQAMVAVPLVSRAGVPLGMLETYFDKVHRAADHELRLLDLFARMAADFVEHCRAELVMREREERLTALLSASAQIFYRMSADWIEMRQLHGGNVLGHRDRPTATWLQDLVYPEDHLLVLRAIGEAMRTGETLEIEHRVVRRDGAVRWVLSRAVPLRDPAGNIIEWFGAASDVTERKQDAAELLRYQGQLEERVQERTAELNAINGALQDEIIERGRVQRAQHELLRHLAVAQEEERRRISRELHDEVGQQLAALLLGLGELATEYAIPANSERLRQLRALAQGVATEVHNVAVELRPTSLDDLGLVRALEAYVGTWSTRAKVAAEFHAEGFDHERLDPAIETTVYRIVQEALTNVRKHASAKSVSVIIQLRPAEVNAIVEDDGVGFDVERRQSSDRLGVLGMRERAALVGGELRIESTAGAGTSVFVRLPRASV